MKQLKKPLEAHEGLFSVQKKSPKAVGVSKAVGYVSSLYI